MVTATSRLCTVMTANLWSKGRLDHGNCRTARLLAKTPEQRKNS
jgi:hypothetical protein